MTVYPRLFGRELPASVRDLLQVPLGGGGRGSRDGANSSYRLGLGFLAGRKGGFARQHLLAAVAADGRPSHRLALAAAHEMLAEHGRCAQQIDQVIEIQRDIDGAAASRLLCAAGLAWERAGHASRAAERYAAALAQRPAEAFAQSRLVAIHLGAARTAEAVLHLRSLLASSPGDQASRVCLGHLLQIEGRHAEAAWEYEQALCLEPDGWEMPADAVHQLAASNSQDQAIGILEDLIAAQPHFPDLRMRLANIHSLRGDDRSARAEYRRALAIHPDYLECHIAMARHELRMGRPHRAAEHFRDAIAINDQHVEIYAGLAMAHHHSNDAEAAAEMLASAARLANNSAVLVAQVGMIAMGDARGCTELDGDVLARLIARKRAAVAAHPAGSELRVEEAMLQRLAGRNDDAFHALRAAVLADPDCKEAWLHLGLALGERGSDPQAMTALANALRLDEKSARLQYRLALICCGEMEFDMALERATAGSENPADARRAIRMAVERLRMGHREWALAADGRDTAVAREEE